MKINNKLLDLATLYANLTYPEIVDALNELVTIREEFEETLFTLQMDSSDMENRLNGILAIETQLEYLNTNISTLEVAVLCVEAKSSEKIFINNGQLATFYLN